MESFGMMALLGSSDPQIRAATVRKRSGPLPNGRGTYLRHLRINCLLQALGSEELDEIAHTAGITPLVVVPRNHLDAFAADDAGHVGIDDGGALVALEIAGNQRLIGVAEDALH